MTPKKTTKSVSVLLPKSVSPEVKPRTRAKSTTTKTNLPTADLAPKAAVKPRHTSASGRKAVMEVNETASTSILNLDRFVSSDEVATRAYHIWLESGCPEGTSTEDWLTAESELRTMAASAS